MKNRAIVHQHFISEAQKVTRTERARNLLNWMKSNGGLVHVFSDEKIFSIDAALNRRNDRYLASGSVQSVPTNIRVTQHRKKPASVMVLGVIASDGQKCPPIFIDAGVRINAAMYQELLRSHVLPWLQARYPEGNYVFQQDGAPAHTARTTQNFLAQHFTHYWTKEQWPPSSPDLNPLDYFFWARVEQKACRSAHSSLAELRAAITKAWIEIPSDEVATAARRFRRRLERVVDAQGDFIE